MTHDDSLYQLNASELIQLLNNGILVAKDIADIFIRRSKLLDPLIHAWVSIQEEYIHTQAERIDALLRENKQLLLPGIPIGIKDIFNTEFYPTQKGSQAWANYKAGNDARCVSYLRQAGGIIFGKTDTAELAVHANGNTLNPHNLSHVTGSSSGGSAAAVATAMVPLALGSQTGGSIIRPASWCGVYAMKPTFGLIPRTGVLKTTDTLDSIGFFTRSIQDMKLLLDILRIKGDNFPIQERKLKERSQKTKKWKVVFVDHHLLPITKKYVKDALNKFQSQLEKLENVDVRNLKLPELTIETHLLHRRIYHPCLAYYLRSEYNVAQDKISPILKNIFKDAETIPPEDYKVALNEQAAMAAEMDHFFAENEIDILLTNSSDGSAPTIEPLAHNDLNPLWTMTWLPVVNVPMFSCADELPFGLQIIGRRFSDYKVLDFLEDLKNQNVIPTKSKVASLATEAKPKSIA